MNAKTDEELYKEFQPFYEEGGTPFEYGLRIYNHAQAPLLTIISDKDKRIEELESDIRDLLKHSVGLRDLWDNAKLQISDLKAETERLKA